MIKNILFDLDGTLTDPQEGIINCIIYALEKLDAEIPPRESLKKYIGPSLWESFKEMLKTDDDDFATKGVMTYRERFSDVGMFENEPYEGIHGVLKKLKDNGYTLYVCTSKPEFFASKIVKHFEMDKFFKKVYGSLLDGSMVDKSELIAHILKEENLIPDDCIMVGDRKYDIEGAGANGIKACAVTYGYGNEQEHKQAIAIFNSTEDIQNYFIK